MYTDVVNKNTSVIYTLWRCITYKRLVYPNNSQTIVRVLHCKALYVSWPTTQLLTAYLDPIL